MIERQKNKRSDEIIYVRNGIYNDEIGRGIIMAFNHDVRSNIFERQFYYLFSITYYFTVGCKKIHVQNSQRACVRGMRRIAYSRTRERP